MVIWLSLFILGIVMWVYPPEFEWIRIVGLALFAAGQCGTQFLWKSLYYRVVKLEDKLKKKDTEEKK